MADDRRDEPDRQAEPTGDPHRSRERPPAAAADARPDGARRAPDRAVLAVAIAVFVAVALVKPWPSGDARPGSSLPRRARRSPTERAVAPTPSPAIRLDCQDPPGWRIFSREFWSGGVLRSWRSLDPGRPGPRPRWTRRSPSSRSARTIAALGYCAPWAGPERPPDDVAVLDLGARRSGATGAVAGVQQVDARRRPSADLSGRRSAALSTRPPAIAGRRAIPCPSGRRARTSSSWPRPAGSAGGRCGSPRRAVRPSPARASAAGARPIARTMAPMDLGLDGLRALVGGGRAASGARSRTELAGEGGAGRPDRPARSDRLDEAAAADRRARGPGRPVDRRRARPRRSTTAVDAARRARPPRRELRRPARRHFADLDEATWTAAIDGVLWTRPAPDPGGPAAPPRRRRRRRS